jgi:tetratricopeptide (TPR) repeat protein
LFEAAYAWDAAGEPDSALPYYERFVSIPKGMQIEQGETLPIVLRRLGVLHAESGNRDRAIEYLTRFVELWRDADPEFQPFVEDARAQLAELAAEPR